MGFLLKIGPMWVRLWHDDQNGRDVYAVTNSSIGVY